MRIDQVLPGASEADAITSMALDIRARLREFCDSDIYSEFVLSESLRDDVLLLEDQISDTCVDATVFHVSYGRPAVTSHLLKRREPLFLSFHNFSPAHHYLAYNPEFAVGLEWGDFDLVRFRDRFVRSFADSQFNAEVLVKLGYRDVVVAPLGLHPGRLRQVAVCPSTAARIEREFAEGFVLVVGQLLPHKRMDQVVATAHLVGSISRRRIPFCIVGSDREPIYSSAIKEFARRLPETNVSFWGSVSDESLATLMRRATIFFGMSDHEGLCVPPLEAMTFGVPVLIKGAGAVPETVGVGGLIMPPDSGPELASEYVTRLWDDVEWRADLSKRGFQRLKQIDSNTEIRKLIEAIRDGIK